MTSRKSFTCAQYCDLPRVLVVDDVFGRNTRAGRNENRENLCAQFLWRDITGDDAANNSPQKVLKPTAGAFFCRAQKPNCSVVGDTVENDLETALESVRIGWSHTKKSKQTLACPWSMVLLDLCFYTGLVTNDSHRQTPGMPEGRLGDDAPHSYFGLTLLDAIHLEFPELPIFILSSKPRKEVSLEFNRRGALGFIDRGALDGPELLEQALWNHGLLPDPNGELVGHSLPLLLALREARRAAGHRENVIICGERGTGKELLARYIHRCGLASKLAAQDERDAFLAEHLKLDTESFRRFIAVNNAVFTPNLFASELFGIQPRTTTGVDGKVGLIEMAKGGDLFLDEIADIPPEVQAALMRVLQERQITRVGGRESLPVDVRFLSATNVDLGDPDHSFRPDLLDRLRSGGTIWLPPLRERLDDIPLLTVKLLREAEAQRPGIRIRQIIPEAMKKLLSHDWPGNVRELRGVIFDAVTRHPDVEYLVAEHVRIESKNKGQKSKLREGSGLRRGGTESTGSGLLSGLLEQMRGMNFDPMRVGDWAGRLPELQREQGDLVGRLLLAALAATKRRTPDHPDGILQIHPAAKLATGDPKLTAAKAADLFKRLLGPMKEELEGDLREAYQVAIRLRPKVAKSPISQGSP